MSNFRDDPRSHAELKAATEVGMKAHVQREEATGELAIAINRELRAIGEHANPMPQTLKYVGSAAVHVYLAEATNFVLTLSQTDTMQDCPMAVANVAQQAFHSDLTKHYTGKRRLKRSGF